MQNAIQSLWAKDTLAVVTGANKGIGYEIAKQLALNGLTVVLTACDQQRSLNALAQLKDLTRSISSNVVFHPLDVRSSESVSDFASWLTNHYEGVDILVVSSSLRQEMENQEILSEEKIDPFVNHFLQAVEEGNTSTKGWPSEVNGGICSILCV